jgi:hypothetical protein
MGIVLFGIPNQQDTLGHYFVWHTEPTGYTWALFCLAYQTNRIHWGIILFGRPNE